MKFYVNGWSENYEYFVRIGHLSNSEIRRMLFDGEVIEKNGDTFRIEIGE